MTEKELFNRALFERSGAKEERKALEKAARMFPWFALPEVALLRLCREEKKCRERFGTLELSFFGNSYYSILGGKIPERDENDRTFDMIDSFLEKKVGRIRPQQTEGETPNEDLARFEAPKIVTEEMAKIYLAQGMKKEAKAIYLELALQHPEKSDEFLRIADTIVPAGNAESPRSE